MKNILNKNKINKTILKTIQLFLYYTIFIFICYSFAFSITINNPEIHNNQIIPINNSLKNNNLKSNPILKVSVNENSINKNLMPNTQFLLFSNLNKNNLNNYSINYSSFLINNKTLINKIKEMNIYYINSTPLFFKKINNFYTGLYISQIPQNLNSINLNLDNPLILNKFTNDNYQLNTINSVLNYNLNNYLLNSYSLSNNKYIFNYFINFKGVSIKLNKKSTLNTALTITTDINLNQVSTNLIDKSKISLTIKF